MELTAIYHSTLESEYAYLYMMASSTFGIRTKERRYQRIVLHYGDPFYFYRVDLYEATKETMDKVTTDDPFDYW